MAKRSYWANEYSWPKKVLLRRLHDRVFRWLMADPYILDVFHPYTPLHMPDNVNIDSDISYTVLLESIFSHGLSAYVYALSEDNVRTVVHIVF